MRRHPYTFLFPFFILLLAKTGFAQMENLPIDRWIKDLSVKTDTRSEKFAAIFGLCSDLDSTIQCQVIAAIKEKGPPDNRRFQIRIRCLQAMMEALRYRPCPDVKPAVHLLHEALQIAYELEDELLQFKIHEILASYYTLADQFGQAILHGMIAIDLSEKLGIDKISNRTTLYQNLAFCLYHAREYRACIETSQWLMGPKHNQYFRPGDSIPNQIQKMFALNTLGLAYEKIGLQDSAFIFFDQAYKLAVSEGDLFWQGLIKGNMGDVYFRMGKYDKAQPLLDIDYHQSVASKEFDNAANSLQWLARIDLFHDKPKEALLKLREAMRLLQISSKPDYLANTLYAFTQVYSKLGNADSLSHYLNKYLIVHDAIEKEASDSRTEIVQKQMQSQENINTIKAMNKEKRRVALIRNFTLVFILFTALMGFMVLNRQKLKLKVKQQEALQQKEKAEIEANQAREQLNLFTRHLREKTNLVDTLQTQLMDKEMSEEQILRISELSRHFIFTDEDWDHFKEVFEKVYPGFFYNLKQKSPDITAAEQRMAALSKLQLSNKDAATLLGIASNSVIKAKQRLRWRLGLDPEADLELYFSETRDFN